MNYIHSFVNYQILGGLIFNDLYKKILNLKPKFDHEILHENFMEFGV